MFTVATVVDGQRFMGTGDHLQLAVADMVAKIAEAGRSTTHVLSIEVSHPDNPAIIGGKPVKEKL